MWTNVSIWTYLKPFQNKSLFKVVYRNTSLKVFLWSTKYRIYHPWISMQSPRSSKKNFPHFPDSALDLQVGSICLKGCLGITWGGESIRSYKREFLFFFFDVTRLCTLCVLFRREYQWLLRNTSRSPAYSDLVWGASSTLYGTNKHH